MTQSYPVPSVYGRSVVFDALNVMALNPDTVDRAIAAGVSGVNYTSVRLKHRKLDLALQDIIRVKNTIDGIANAFVATSADDVRRAKAEGKLAIILGLQDTAPLADDIAYVRLFADLGVKIIQVTHNYQGLIGSGCLEPVDSGLSKHGARFVAEMVARGIVPDISHCGVQTSLDVIKLVDKPVLCTHSNPRSLFPSLRNKTDEVIYALAEKGGVLGIAAYAGMVYRGGKVRPTLSDVLDAYDLAIRMIGPERVCIGSDTCEGLFSLQEWESFAGLVAYPEVTRELGDWYSFETWFAEGLETLEGTPGIAAGLRARGHPDADIGRIMGENALDVIDQY